MIKIIISLLITIIIIYARIWLINSVFVDKKIKTNLTWKIFLMGFFLVAWLFVYKYFLNYLGINQFYIVDNMSWQSIGIFVIYCMIFLIIISAALGNIKRKKIIELIILGLILFIIIGYGGYISGVAVILMYYFVAAYAEEITKFGAGENIFLKEGKNNSDLIFFCILVGLGFAIVENLFYLGSNIFNSQINLIGMSIGRGLISSMLHVITTGIVAYIVTKGLNKKTKLSFVLFVLMGIILGFAVHSIYNLSLFFNRKGFSITIIILGYFVFSFLIFKSDKIYLKNL